MAAAYRLEFAPAAARAFAKLPRAVQVRLKTRIDSLASDPRPEGAVMLTGGDRLYRIRAGDYRVIYQVRDRILLILVLKVGHRREIYR